MKGKKNLIIIAIVIAISLIGVTYAFFEYYGIGSNQKVTAGAVNLILNEGKDTINITNVFPETIEEARKEGRTDNVITFTVSGINTTEDQDIYYEIMLNEGDSEAGMTRFDPEDLVFDLIELNEDETEGTYLVNAMSFKDFNSRRIWVNTVYHQTETVVNKTYKLRMWLSEDVLISNSNPNADYPATGYENHYASVKVSVYGDFVEKQQPYNYMARLGTTDLGTGGVDDIAFWPNAIYEQSQKIKSVSFISMDKKSIDTRYEVATIKEDVSDTTKSGNVKVWLENDELVTNDDGTETQYYKMYVASEGTTFFPENSDLMFYNFSNLSEINFENINTTQTNIMSRMFYGCSSLTTLYLNSFDTRSVTNMRMLFFGCKKLESLIIDNFDTSQVTDMAYMFYNCYKLLDLDLSHFDTSNVTLMGNMFLGCDSLVELDLSNFNTSQVTSMTNMFYSCNNLIRLDISNFDTSNVKNMSYMFYECKSLTTLNLDSFNTTSVKTMACMFNYCESLTELDVTNFNTSQVTDMSYMFGACRVLGVLDLSNFDTSAVTTTEKMFSGCWALTTIYANTDWNTTTLTNSTSMFNACTKLVGAIAHSSSKIDITMANPITGYFTQKEV